MLLWLGLYTVCSHVTTDTKTSSCYDVTPHISVLLCLCMYKTYFCDSDLFFPKLFQRFDKQVTGILNLQVKQKSETKIESATGECCVLQNLFLLYLQSKTML